MFICLSTLIKRSKHRTKYLAKDKDRYYENRNIPSHFLKTVSEEVLLILIRTDFHSSGPALEKDVSWKFNEPLDQNREEIEM